MLTPAEVNIINNKITTTKIKTVFSNEATQVLRNGWNLSDIKIMESDRFHINMYEICLKG